jgi:hypothetical protein
MITDITSPFFLLDESNFAMRLMETTPFSGYGQQGIGIVS